MGGYSSEISLLDVLSGWGVSYRNYQRKYSATTKLHCNQKKEAQGNGFCQRRVPAQEDKEQRCLCGYDVMADFPEHAVKQYGDLAAR